MRDLALHLRERGHAVEIITAVPGPEAVDGLRVHRLGAPRLPGAGIVFTALAFRRIAALLRAGRYDLVHVHFGIVAPLAYGATAIAQRLGIPTVATFHSVLKHFDPALWLVRGLMGAGEWRVQWSAVSTVVRDSIRPLVGTVEVALLPNGVDVGWWRHDAIAPAHGEPRASLRAVATMRLHRRKRPAALVRCMAAARRRLPAACPIRVEVLGDGPERSRLRRQIARTGAGDLVTLHGWRPRDEVRAALHEADVFLLPSRLEAFGIAALEARCAGVPVVAMHDGGARDFLTDGHDALLARSDAEFTDAIVRLATDASLRTRLRAACAAPPVGYDWPSIVARHERLYAAAADTA